MTNIFHNEDFWILYLKLEGILLDDNQNIIKEIEEDKINAIIKPLSSHFVVHQEKGKKEHDKQRLKEIGLFDFIGKKIEYEVNTVFFDFQLKNFSLLIESNFDVSGCEHYLYLKYQEDKYLLGWWDLARWHPFCLRYNEFNVILENIKTYDTKWGESDIPLLLLKNFVGFGNGDEKNNEELSVKADKILEKLQIQYHRNLSSCFYKQNYHWKETNLGLEFTGDYNCYSLRNLEHKDSKEESFPFELWNKLMNDLKQ